MSVDHEEAVQYVGRPGISPALAALIALGRVRRDHRILDVGCGIGTDALLLASWGFRRVEGIDPDAPSIGVARARATRKRLGQRVSFQRIGAEDLLTRFPASHFDVVLHTLVSNNLRKDMNRHFRNLAAILKPEGLLLLHERTKAAHTNARPGKYAPLPSLRRHFRLSAGVATQLAEQPTSRPGPAYARVVLWLGSPRK